MNPDELDRITRLLQAIGFRVVSVDFEGYVPRVATEGRHDAPKMGAWGADPRVATAGSDA